MNNDKNATRSSPRALSKAETEEIRYAFQLFDTEGKGVILVKEIRDAMEGMDKAEELLVALPEDGSETLSLQDFTALLTNRHGNDDMERVFFLFDTEKKGYISFQDLKRIASDLGETMTDDELQEMIDRADLNEDGKVNLEEFRTMMNKKLFT
mmetsp:Transcript_12260/g.28407  ORF Transcript_12260/g.28407 Transcript_12260/m.28407 type:complete len:153 (+) Transcript_12260:143-601(+)